MKEENLTILESEIEKRLKSDEWDRQLAGKVLQKRERIRGRRKKIIFRGVPAALGLAATVFIAVLVYDYGQSRYEQLDTIIASQVNGTYRDVFLVEAKSGKQEDIYQDNIDDFISATLAVR